MRGPERGTQKVQKAFIAAREEYRTAAVSEVLKDCAHVYFGIQAYNRMRYLVSKAERSIEIDIFIWRADSVGREMAETVTKAADRGVRVIIRKEITGDIFELADEFISTKTSADPVWKKFWNHPFITVKHENRHDHSKVFVIDDMHMLIGSMNIGEDDCHQWHECVVELSGASFVRQYEQGNTALPPLHEEPAVAVLRSAPGKPMESAVLDLLRSAKKSIRIEMAYLSDPTVIETLAAKSRENVYVFIILPQSSPVHYHANIAAAAALMKAGRRRRILVASYPKQFLHTKMILVDRVTLFLGSTNLMSSSLTKMGETNVLIHRAPKRCLRTVRRRFLKDMIASSLIKRGSRLSGLWHWMLSGIGL